MNCFFWKTFWVLWSPGVYLRAAAVWCGCRTPSSSVDPSLSSHQSLFLQPPYLLASSPGQRLKYSHVHQEDVKAFLWSIMGSWAPWTSCAWLLFLVILKAVASLVLRNNSPVSHLLLRFMAHSPALYDRDTRMTCGSFIDCGVAVMMLPASTRQV